MKMTLFCLLMIFSLISFSQSRNEEQIRNVLREQTEAWNRGDIESFMEGYWRNDSLLFIGKSGINRGWQNTFNNYKKGYPDTSAMGKLNFNILKVKKLSGKYYYVVGQWHLKRSIGDVGGHFDLLWRKIKGKWVIVADHSS